MFSILLPEDRRRQKIACSRLPSNWRQGSCNEILDDYRLFYDGILNVGIDRTEYDVVTILYDL